MKFLSPVVMVLAACLPCLAGEEVRLSSLDLSKFHQGWGKALADKAVTGKPMVLAGKQFAHGVGTHARSVAFVELDGQVERFQAVCKTPRRFTAVSPRRPPTWTSTPVCPPGTSSTMRPASPWPPWPWPR